jgi:hypothetical protein
MADANGRKALELRLSVWWQAQAAGNRPYGKAPAGAPLEAARKRRDEAAGLLRDGVDPATWRRQVKAARAEAHANTFAVVADELLAKKKTGRGGGCHRGQA